MVVVVVFVLLKPPPIVIPAMSIPASASIVFVVETVVLPPIVTVTGFVPPSQLST